MKSFRRFNEGVEKMTGSLTDPKIVIESIEVLEKQLAELETFETQQLEQLRELKKEGDFEEDLKGMLAGSGLPKPAVDMIYYNFILLMHDTFRKTLKDIIKIILRLLKSGASNEEIENNEEIKELKTYMAKLSSQVLDIPTEELEKITAQFLQGVNKFQKMKEENSEISNSRRNLEADPFAEENWSGESEADMLKKSFESKKYR